jgi:hypothetical protein
VLRGEPVVVHVRDSGVFSGAAFVIAFGDETQQMFQEAHVRARNGMAAYST